MRCGRCSLEIDIDSMTAMRARSVELVAHMVFKFVYTAKRVKWESVKGVERDEKLQSSSHLVTEDVRR